MRIDFLQRAYIKCTCGMDAAVAGAAGRIGYMRREAACPAFATNFEGPTGPVLTNDAC